MALGAAEGVVEVLPVPVGETVGLDDGVVVVDELGVAGLVAEVPVDAVEGFAAGARCTVAGRVPQTRVGEPKTMSSPVAEAEGRGTDTRTVIVYVVAAPVAKV